MKAKKTAKKAPKKKGTLKVSSEAPRKAPGGFKIE